jgi:hypothetical protein
MTQTATPRREPVEVQPMIDALKLAVRLRLEAGKLRVGDKITHLRFYQLDAEECKMFLQRLRGYHIPDTSYQLTWSETRHYFEITPQAA